MADILRPTTFLFDGQKAVAIGDLPDSAWTWYTQHPTEDERGAKEYYLRVPWLNRGVALRSQAVARLPFALVDASGEDYDKSEDWENKVGFLPNPSRLLYLIESSLTLLGKAYVFKSRNRVKTLGLKYLAASTITPQLDAEQGLMGFKRQLGANAFQLDEEDLLYFWALDPFVELGPGNNSPATAALSAAGVLFNVDTFAAQFFERGAIKVMLLTVKGNPQAPEVAKIKSWWQKVASGIKGAWGNEVIIADDIEPVTVGEGVKELSDSELVKEKREDIAAALGIPITLLWSSSASGLGGGGVVAQDDIHFYDKTIVPEADFIQGVLNEQLFEAMGLHWQFRPETLDVFQRDEQQRSQAYANYVNAGMQQSVAAQILGIELPAGMEYDELDENEADEIPPLLKPFTGEGGQQEPNEQAQADLKRWERKALKKGAGAPFESRHIPADVQQHIRAMLDGAETEDEIKAAFEVERTVAQAEESAMLAQIKDWYGRAQDETLELKKKNRPAEPG